MAHEKVAYITGISNKGNVTPFSVVDRRRNHDWAMTVHETIAIAFESKNIVMLVDMLCNSTNSPIYTKKTSSSPLYVYSNKDSDASVREKISLVETAIFLLLNDKKVKTDDLSRAYGILDSKNTKYTPPVKIKAEFQKRLGIVDSATRTDMVIERLKQARNEFQF